MVTISHSSLPFGEAAQEPGDGDLRGRKRHPISLPLRGPPLRTKKEFPGLDARAQHPPQAPKPVHSTRRPPHGLSRPEHVPVPTHDYPHHTGGLHSLSHSHQDPPQPPPPEHSRCREPVHPPRRPRKARGCRARVSGASVAQAWVAAAGTVYEVGDRPLAGPPVPCPRVRLGLGLGFRRRGCDP